MWLWDGSGGHWYNLTQIVPESQSHRCQPTGTILFNIGVECWGKRGIEVSKSTSTRLCFIDVVNIGAPLPQHGRLQYSKAFPTALDSLFSQWRQVRLTFAQGISVIFLWHFSPHYITQPYLILSLLEYLWQFNLLVQPLQLWPLCHSEKESIRDIHQMMNRPIHTSYSMSHPWKWSTKERVYVCTPYRNLCSQESEGCGEAVVKATEQFIVSSQIFKTFHLSTYFSGDKGRTLFFLSNLLPAVGDM